MEKKNVSFTKDGMKVGVKEMSEEEYADRTQRYGCCLLFALSKHCNMQSTRCCSDGEGFRICKVLTSNANNSVLVNTWNQSSFPAYKSRLWNKEEQAKNKAASSGRA